MLELNNNFLNVVFSWLLTSGLKIAGIIFATYLFRRFSNVFVNKMIKKIIISDKFLSKEAKKKRENTLVRIIDGTIGIVILLIAGLMILQELGVAIAPLLAAAGIAGIAFGFGGQYLIRDAISGLFIILENQYRVGDVVCLDETCGSVENISLRTATLRDLDGTVHHIPHGEVKRVSNLTKDYSRVNLDIGIGYDSDIEKVIRVVNQVGEKLAEDSEWKEFIIKKPQFLRINDFADSAIIIKILGETKPTKQWDVAGELRKRLKIAFDKEGIEIPFPQRVIHQSKN